MKKYYYTHPEKALGGMIGTALGAGVGTLIAPGVGTSVGATIGGSLGSGAEKIIKQRRAGEEEEQQPLTYASSSYGNTMRGGGKMEYLPQNALQFTGPSHENGGIQIPNAEVEGGETMDFIEFQAGGKIVDKRDGTPYIFSKRIKLPGSNVSFAEKHKQMLNNNASEQEIKQLAQLQEQVTGRSRGNAVNAKMLEEQKGMTSAERDEKEKRKKEAGGKVHRKAQKLQDEEGYDEDQAYAVAFEMQDDNELKYGGKKEYESGGKKEEYQTGGDPEWWQIGQYKTPLQVASQQPVDYSDELDQISKGLQQGNIWRTRRMMQGLPIQEPTATATPLPEDARSPQPTMFNPLQSGNAFFGVENQQFGPEQLLRSNPDAVNTTAGQQQDQTQQQTQGTDTQQTGTENPVLPTQGPETPLAQVNSPEVDLNQDVQTAEAPVNPETGKQFQSATEAAGLETAGGASGAGSGAASAALQFVPEAMNFLTGALTEPEDAVEDATQISNRSVEKYPVNYNIQPQLARNAASYRSILDNPNASINQKLAAQSKKMQADSQAMARKINKENQMRANRAKLQSSLDRQNAQFRNQYRDDLMKAEAQFGPLGNISRQAVGSASQKLLMQQAMRNKRQMDEARIEAMREFANPEVAQNYFNRFNNIPQ